MSLYSNDSEETKAAIFCEFVYGGDGTLEDTYHALEGVLEQVGANSAASLTGTEEKDLRDINVFRHVVPETINATVAARKQKIPELHKIATDMAVPAEQTARIYSFYTTTLAEHGLEFAVFGHVGNGHVHVNILPRDVEELVLAKQLYEEITKEVVSLGGAVAGEHGIGRLKRELLALQYDENCLVTMREIKNFFDPKGILNPGVLFA